MGVSLKGDGLTVGDMNLFPQLPPGARIKYELLKTSTKTGKGGSFFWIVQCDFLSQGVNPTRFEAVMTSSLFQTNDSGEVNGEEFTLRSPGFFRIDHDFTVRDQVYPRVDVEWHLSWYFESRVDPEDGVIFVPRPHQNRDHIQRFVRQYIATCIMEFEQ